MANDDLITQRDDLCARLRALGVPVEQQLFIDGPGTRRIVAWTNGDRLPDVLTLIHLIEARLGRREIVNEDE
jgi:hypothetical protein